MRDDVLLPPELLPRLDRLDVLSRKVLAGKLRGERRSKRRGQSVEFADYRNYVVGDDLRHIDWNIYGRLDRLFLKMFLEEEDLSLYVVADLSASMNFGTPNKALYARRVAAALAYVGLVHHNRVVVYGLGARVKPTGPWAGRSGGGAGEGSSGGVVESGAMRGRVRVPKMLDFLSRLTPSPPGEAVSLEAALRRVTLSARVRGVVVLISDFLDPAGYERSLRPLLGGRYDVYAVQILSPEEIDPTLAGDLRLKDVEDGAEAEVSVNAALLKQYRATVNAYCLGLKQHVVRRGGQYLFSSTAVPFDTLVLAYLRQRGLLA
ncbi:MAG: DUF58 domain-containing protein [Tepidisphaerales bacterium]